MESGIAMNRHIPAAPPGSLFPAVRQSMGMVAITDSQGCLVYVNPRFLEITGYDYRTLLISPGVAP